MPDHQIKRALISVYDKTGIVDFARALVDEFGIEIISTGGTAKLLKENNIPVTLVEDITGWGEMLDGRVKTLHPKIHAAILADRDNPKHMQQLAEAGIAPIDMVVVNLYPFEKTVADPNCKFEDAIEMIDIGGPCLLRAAAKNHRNVLALSNRSQYTRTLRYLQGHTPDRFTTWHQWLMTKAFQETGAYEACIHNWVNRYYCETPFTPVILRDFSMMTPTPGNELKYGENPHQRAGLYGDDSGHQGLFCGPMCAADDHECVQFSYNNYLDGNAAYSLARDLHRELALASGECACVFVKHTNPCGVGIAINPIEAYRRAYLGDPNAAMGGVLACSFPIDASFAVSVMQSLDLWGKEVGAGAFFIELWIAPHFNREALEVVTTRKSWGRRIRLLNCNLDEFPAQASLEVRSIAGGAVMQTSDLVGLNEDQWQVVTDRKPTDQELADLRLAWLIAKHTKSNAISICKDGMLIGNGAGQMSRVMSCRIAAWLANENGHADKLPGSAAASDAFFPFRDGPDLLIDSGVTAIIQPGGSKRDADTIAACNQRNAAMIFTGTRHFRH